MFSLLFLSCCGTEEFVPGNAYFTENNTFVLYYNGEYSEADVYFELHSLNPSTDERITHSILTVDKSDGKLIIKYENTVSKGFITKLYVYVYGKYKTAVTVEWPKS